jgi:hypothetical protein
MVLLTGYVYTAVAPVVIPLGWTSNLYQGSTLLGTSSVTNYTGPYFGPGVGIGDWKQTGASCSSGFCSSATAVDLTAFNVPGVAGRMERIIDAGSESFTNPLAEVDIFSWSDPYDVNLTVTGYSFTSSPEPSTVALFGMGFAAVCMLRRRKSKMN